MGLWLTLASLVCGQSDDTRPLDHTDYDRWNNLTSWSLSNDGRWVMFGASNGKNQVTLRFRDTASDKEFSVTQGTGAQFSFDSKRAVYRITPDPELLKKLRKEKKKPEEMPKNQLAILDLESGQSLKIENVASFRMPRENGDWVAFMLGNKPDESKLKSEKSTVAETFEVTPTGLKRPGPKPGRAAKSAQARPSRCSSGVRDMSSSAC